MEKAIADLEKPSTSRIWLPEKLKISLKKSKIQTLAKGIRKGFDGSYLGSLRKLWNLLREYYSVIKSANPVSREVFRTFSKALEECLDMISDIKTIVESREDLKEAVFRVSAEGETSDTKLGHCLKPITEESIRRAIHNYACSTGGLNYTSSEATLSYYLEHHDRGLLHTTYKAVVSLRDTTQQGILSIYLVST